MMSFMEPPQTMEQNRKIFITNEIKILRFTDTELAPYTYDIEARVSSAYDDYVPLKIYHFKLEVDPKSDKPKFEKLINIDNQHSNCKHYRGIQHAVYTRGYETVNGLIIAPKLEFFTYWNRACGSEGFSNRVTFSGETQRSACQLDRDNTVRVRITFSVF
jgi:hypothetical protein